MKAAFASKMAGLFSGRPEPGEEGSGAAEALELLRASARGRPVHQIVASLEYGDAVSNYALLIQRLLRESGVETRLFAETAHPKLSRHATPLARLAARGNEGAAWILHYSTRTGALDPLREARGSVGLVYHNVTPSRFASVLGSNAMSAAFVARQELAEFLDRPRAIVADSAYNAADLREMGAREVGVMPLAIDFDRFDEPPSRRLLAALREGGDANFLTVGRLAPHKKIEDAVKIFYYYQNYINARSRLYIVGDGTASAPYVHQLKQLIEDLAIPNVHLTGKVRFRELLTYYKAADVYLCMSEHEGFCVPLVEAMRVGVPIIAFKQEAVAETLGGAGVLAAKKRADLVAEMAHLILQEKELRLKIIEKQRERAADFHIDRLRLNLARFLDRLTA